VCEKINIYCDNSSLSKVYISSQLFKTVNRTFVYIVINVRIFYDSYFLKLEFQLEFGIGMYRVAVRMILCQKIMSRLFFLAC
jgi:hypothetical protein